MAIGYPLSVNLRVDLLSSSAVFRCPVAFHLHCPQCLRMVVLVAAATRHAFRGAHTSIQTVALGGSSCRSTCGQRTVGSFHGPQHPSELSLCRCVHDGDEPHCAVLFGKEIPRKLAPVDIGQSRGYPRLRAQAALPDGRLICNLPGTLHTGLAGVEASISNAAHPEGNQGFHLILHPTLGNCSFGGSFPANKASKAAARSSPVGEAPLPGRVASNRPR